MFDTILAVIVVLVLASFVYGAIRAVWRLHEGDVKRPATTVGRSAARAGQVPLLSHP